jgi:phosphoadenosine phosphosulfate reductase
MIEIAKHYQNVFEQLEPAEMLEYVLKAHPGKVAFSSSLGAEDQVITHFLAQIANTESGLTSPLVFTLDTGRLFAETYELIEKTNARYKINIQVYFPNATSVEKMVQAHGINLFYHSVENRKTCCHIRKIEPLKRALSPMDIWITGLRREQSPTRTRVSYAEWDDANKVIKINPLLDWTDKQVWDFIRDNAIPYNTLHDKGFPSIGCQPCTKAVLPGDDIRSGRWWWENPDTKECGLHPLRGNKLIK